ncbi:MAG TPA: gluconate 2-dehydrogenase subunit 3 family protein [Cyclobacteriaceae bacterium]|nr:gluconate 2-dehydrogenase subunit 3 family protein [Cyclobacteriaceae bacterium]
MNRREAIQRTALALGYTISAPLISAVLHGCKAKPDLAFKPVFLDEEQGRLVSAIAETIIPRTNTPGAVDAGVPGFIDDLLANVYSSEQQKAFTDGLTAFAEEAKSEIGDAFIDATPEQQLGFVKKKNTEALSGGSGSGSQSEGWWAAGMGSSKPFFLEVKELTILGFFTSEAGATQVLQYKQVPGPFQGCVPLAEVGKAWAT